MNENLTSQLSARLTALTNLVYFFCFIIYSHIFKKGWIGTIRWRRSLKQATLRFNRKDGTWKTFTLLLPGSSSTTTSQWLASMIQRSKLGCLAGRLACGESTLTAVHCLIRRGLGLLQLLSDFGRPADTLAWTRMFRADLHRFGVCYLSGEYQLVRWEWQHRPMVWPKQASPPKDQGRATLNKYGDVASYSYHII